MRSQMNATRMAERKQMNDIKMAFGSQESFTRSSCSNNEGTFLTEAQRTGFERDSQNYANAGSAKLQVV